MIIRLLASNKAAAAAASVDIDLKLCRYHLCRLLDGHHLKTEIPFREKQNKIPCVKLTIGFEKKTPYLHFILIINYIPLAKVHKVSEYHRLKLYQFSIQVLTIQVASFILFCCDRKVLWLKSRQQLYCVSIFVIHTVCWCWRPSVWYMYTSVVGVLLFVLLQLQ